MTPDLIAESVLFRLTPAADPAAFADAARDLDRWLAARPGCLARCLSTAPDGLWTDFVLWSDMAAAQTAATAVMSAPEAAAFMAMIVPDSVVMGHGRVTLWRPA